MRTGEKFKNTLVFHAACQVAALWKPMAAWAVLTWLAGVIILAPLSSVVLGWHLGRVEYGIVGNEDLAAWLFTSRGISYLWILGTLGLLLSIIRFSGYFWILENAAEGRGVALIDLFVRVARRMPRLLRLCAVVVLAGWLALLPLAGALWGVYGFFLGEHDPNYYLAERPPEWTHALITAGGIVLIWVCLVAGLALRLFMALPVYLHEGCSLRAAVRQSLALTRGSVRRWAVRFVAILGGFSLVRIVLNSLLFTLGAIGLSWVAELSPLLSPLIFSTAVFIALSFLLDGVMGFLISVLISSTVVEGYFESISEQQCGRRASVRAQSGSLAGGGVRIRPWLRPGPLFLIGSVLAGGSIVFSGWFFDHAPPPRVIVVSAHRAGPPPAPENTLSALEAAIAAGADYAEIDVMRTADGVVVVTHDADLMRQAGDPRRISETPYSELRGVVKRGPAEIPEEERYLETLAAFLERAGDRIGLMVELKYYGPDPRLVPAVADVLAEHQGETEVILMSLDLSAVRALRQRFPDHRVGYVSTVAVGAVTELDVDFLALAGNRITRSVMLAARERGVEVHAWTPNRVDRIADLVQLGVDGIITDYPHRARAVEAEINGMSPVERFLLRFRRLILEGVDDSVKPEEDVERSVVEAMETPT